MKLKRHKNIESNMWKERKINMSSFNDFLSEKLNDPKLKAEYMMRCLSLNLLNLTY